jgi:hypothetical protein
MVYLHLARSFLKNLIMHITIELLKLVLPEIIIRIGYKYMLQDTKETTNNKGEIKCYRPHLYRKNAITPVLKGC